MAGIQSSNLLVIYRRFGAMNETTMGPASFGLFLLLLLLFEGKVVLSDIPRIRLFPLPSFAAASSLFVIVGRTRHKYGWRQSWSIVLVKYIDVHTR